MLNTKQAGLTVCRNWLKHEIKSIKITITLSTFVRRLLSWSSLAVPHHENRAGGEIESKFEL